jgi:hypothetical protein
MIRYLLFQEAKYTHRNYRGRIYMGTYYWPIFPKEWANFSVPLFLYLWSLWLFRAPGANEAKQGHGFKHCESQFPLLCSMAIIFTLNLSQRPHGRLTRPEIMDESAKVHYHDYKNNSKIKAVFTSVRISFFKCY